MNEYILISNVYVNPNVQEPNLNSDQDEEISYILNVLENATDLSTGSEELASHIKDWPSLYHLHSKRVNLLRPLEEFLRERSILEIGSGCGAITRYLGEIGCSVTALETDFLKARTTASRCRDLSNVKVVYDSLLNFPKSEQFDVITLIGALEHAHLYSGGEDPIKALLDKITPLLRPEGLLLIAIENKLGLKYWAGAPEDHTGQAYLGIENRYTPSSTLTFGKKELLDLLGTCGFKNTTFLYPFPDYKIPDSVVTGKGLQTAAFSVPMLLLENFEYIQSEYYSNHFSTSLAAVELDKNGLLAEFSNSFLVAAAPTELPNIVPTDLLAVRYNSQRRKEYQKINTFREKDGEIVVEKSRLHYQSPVPGGPIRNLLTREPYFKGRLMLFDAIKVVSEKQWTLQSLSKWARSYFDILKEVATEQNDQPMLDGKYMDLTPFNIVLDDKNEAHIFDQEWIYPTPLPLGYVFFRGINYSLGAISFFDIPAEETSEDILQLTCALYQQFLPLDDNTVANYRNIEIDMLSGIGTNGYVPFQPAPIKIRKESLVEKQVLRLQEEKDQTQTGLKSQIAELESNIANIRHENHLNETGLKNQIHQLQINLAHIHHESFLKEAELEALQNISARQQPSLPGLEKFSSLVNHLSNLVANFQPPPPATKPPPASEADAIASLNQKITDLQNDLLWYKRTYEERSLLGTIKQKISYKISK